MSTRRIGIGAFALLMFFSLSPFLQGQQTPPDPPVTEPMPVTAQEEAEIQPSCGDCHEIAEPFKRNPHARGTAKGEPVPNPICESCHGDGTAHMEAGGDPTLIILPVGFSGSQSCLTCHDLSTHEKSRRQGVHANSETVNCLTCHSVHHSEPLAQSLLRRKEVEVCSSCHSTYVAGFRSKPFAHRIGRGGMECSSCHEPHAKISREPVRRTRSGQIACAECHTDKKGPFVFPHGANEVFEPGRECMNCHEVHGSNNPKQLRRANVWQLCIECHSPITGTTLGSQPPAFHNLNNPRYQNCTTCHVAVHGSNRSPALLK
jgi:DmsE family decaheme c-type cytochrome